MDHDAKIRLLQAEHEARKEVAMYEQLVQDATKSLNRAKQHLANIREQMAESYQVEGKRYTAHEIRQCRLAISQAFGTGQGLALRDITDHCADFPAELVARELHKLSRDRRSPIVWNGGKGTASKYYRREVVV